MTVTLESGGKVVLPKEMRTKLHIRKGAKLRAEWVGDGVKLTVPAPATQPRFVRKGKLTVVAPSGTPFDALRAVAGVRNEREEQVLHP